ncbi:MAG: M24 family metallopeptidase [Candidatus Limnocylindrales bacterium]
MTGDRIDGPLEYLRPSDAEFERRRSALGELLHSAGVDALLIYGNEAARHEIRFLTGWPAGWDTYVCWTPGALPLIYLPSPNHVETASTLTSGVALARDVGVNPVATVAGELGAASHPVARRRRVGILGPIPASTHRRLGDAFGDVRLIDVSAEFRALRLVKSEEEIAWTRQAAGLCDEAIRALVMAVRPGVKDDELVGTVEYAYRRRGGDHGICFLSSFATAGGGRLAPAQYASRRQLRDGDAVMIELSAGVAGYTSQILRTIALEGPLPAAFERVHHVADAAFQAIAERVRPGATAADLLAAARVIDDAGLTVVDDVVHGYGGGYLPPVLRTPATQVRPVADLVLAPGMMLVVQPNVVDPDRHLGVQTGELLLVTPTGHERLHQVPAGLLMAAPRSA